MIRVRQRGRMFLLTALLLSWACHRPLCAETFRPRIPRPAIMMYGYSDNQRVAARKGTHPREPLWQHTLRTANIIEGQTTRAPFVRKLRQEGKLFAWHISNRISASDPVEDIVKRWSAPFRNTLGGQLPGGFDAISIDELHPWPDADPRSKRLVTVFATLKERYPNKLLIPAVRWQVACSGMTDVSGQVFDAQLRALKEHADLLFLEAYLSETNAQFSLFSKLATNLDKRQPGLLSKTIFGLAIPQNLTFPYADSSPYVEFSGYLDEQVHRIRSDPLTSSMPGVGFWAHYRGRPGTVIHSMKLARHYYLDGQTTHHGDGSYQHRVLTPSFEKDTRDWSLSPGASVVEYTTIPGLPNYHAARFASHGSRLLKTRRGERPTRATQRLKIRAKTAYTLSAWVTAEKPGTSFSASLSVNDGRGLTREAHFPNLLSQDNGPRRFQRVFLTFTTQETSEAVTIEFNDATAKVETVLYWDFVELDEDEPALPVPPADW